jgi:hypothetical protein
VWFRGSPLLDEIVFFHRPSRTAVLADLSENFEEAFLRRHWSWWQRPIARLWKIVEPYGYAPLEWRLSWRNRAPARRKNYLDDVKFRLQHPRHGNVAVGAVRASPCPVANIPGQEC